MKKITSSTRRATRSVDGPTVAHHRNTSNIAINGSDPTNPKDLWGVQKVSLTKLPSVALLHAAHAMMNGAEKYGPYNWRDKPVRASIYVDACERHLNAWFDGEQEAVDSGAHHLGHAIACLAILLDAEATGNLVDDRPIAGVSGAFSRVLGRLNRKIAREAPEGGNSRSKRVLPGGKIRRVAG